MTQPMDALDRLESTAVALIREAHSQLPRLCLLWSVGKDSTVLLWLVRKAFFGRCPLPLIHIDSGFEFPEVLAYRDRLVKELGLTLIIGSDPGTVASGRTFPSTRQLPAGDPGRVERRACCASLRTAVLARTLDGSGPRQHLSLVSGSIEDLADRTPFTAALVAIRAIESVTRGQDRPVSPRGPDRGWSQAEQPVAWPDPIIVEPVPGGTQRIHPLLDWTEQDVWEYIEREGIPVVPRYLDQGNGTRCRSLGCEPCTSPMRSAVTTVAEVREELRRLDPAQERCGRHDDADQLHQDGWA